MLRTIILIFEALLFIVMLFFAGKFLNGANTGLLIILIGISLPAIEYLRRFLPKKVEKKSKAIRVRAQELRQIFNTRIMNCRANNLSNEVIIRHVSREDGYPDIDEKEKGPSSWFDATLEQTSHVGIHVGLGFNSLKSSSYGYKFLNKEKNEEGDIEAMLVGEIPFDVIESVNLEGDKDYPFPHIFCRFPFNGKPYERLFYAKTIIMENGQPWYKEIADYEVVKLNTREEDWD